MTFKRLVKIGAFIIVAGLMVGCQSGEFEQVQNKNNGNPLEVGEAAYMSVNVQLPTAGAKGRMAATRVPYGEKGTEEGKDPENRVQSLLLVLADRANNNYLAHSVVPAVTMAQGQTSVAVSAEFERTVISELYESTGNDKGSLKAAYKEGINVFVFCNPPQVLTEKMVPNNLKGKPDWLDFTYNVTDSKLDAIWKNNTFLMSNYGIETRKLPGNIDMWKKYKDPSSAFNLSGHNDGVVDNYADGNLGAIDVERAVARLDFKDGSKKGNNTYNITVDQTKDELNVQLVRMALVNMGKQCYYLRHMSDGGTSALSPFAMPEETPTNYVWDMDAATKKTFIDNKDNKNAYNSDVRDLFYFPLFNTNGKIDETQRTEWDSYKIEDVLGPEMDNWEKKEYHIWRYVTENTLPESPAGQLSGISTGIVFKGKLIAGLDMAASTDKALKSLESAIVGTYKHPEETKDYTDKIDGKIYPMLFLFQNKLYTGWNDGIKNSAEYKEDNSTLKRMLIRKEATDAKSLDDLYTDLITAYEGEDKNAQDEAIAAFRAGATKAGFTIYQASEDEDYDAGYYFYYYYWNRHRDNEEAFNMGIMEFATVRNNVYKLAVTGISKIGYPRIQENNPDPIDPEDPDESDKLYITVQVQVLPWVVRENNIEF